MVVTDVSAEEYFDMLAESDIKLEYYDGEIVAMAGAKVSHNRIVSNLLRSFLICLEEHGCEIFGSDQLVQLDACNIFVFPDISIVCEKPIFEDTSRGLEALTNPSIIIEVLSNSTEAYDNAAKRECYQALDSMQEYIMVSSDKLRVERFKRLSKYEWLQHIYTSPDDWIRIGECEMEMQKIYQRVFEKIEV